MNPNHTLIDVNALLSQQSQEPQLPPEIEEKLSEFADLLHKLFSILKPALSEPQL